MKKSVKRIIAVTRKEFLHIMKDPRTLLIVFLMPVVQLVMFGYAFNLEIQNVKLAVIDHANSVESRQLIRQFEGSRYFQPFFFDKPVDEAQDLFKSQKARAVMVIPFDFDRRLQRDTQTAVQFLIDASDPNAATLIRNYCNQVLLSFNETRGYNIPLPFDLRSSILFNPDMKSAFFFVPGIIALILVMISALLTSITIAREKEMGTMEQILVSPIRPGEIVLGKVLPYIFLAFLDATIILLIGIFLFGVPFRGSMLLMLVLSTLYIITALSLGLMISTRAHTQQVAMMMALIITLLPTFMLSGLIFPIPSMPLLLQYITYLVPAKYYLLIIRGILLKGSVFLNLWEPTLFLALMTLILLGFSIRKFSMTLEK